MDQLKNFRTEINKPSDTVLSLVGLTVTMLPIARTLISLLTTFA
jgi:hypothetical protein